MANRAPTISSHVLDTSRGAPAVGLSMAIFLVGAAGGEIALGSATTDADGRIDDLLGRPLETRLRPLRPLPRSIRRGGFETVLGIPNRG